MMLHRIVAAGHRVLDTLHAAMLTVFFLLCGMVLAAWLGGGLAAVALGAILGLTAGLAIAKRVWFGKPAPPVPMERIPDAWRLPYLQDEFERRLGRQRVYGFLLVAVLLVFVVVRFSIEFDWPRPFGVPYEGLLAGGCILLAVMLPLAWFNWRCPNCRRNLGAGLSVRQCPHCGVVLRG